MSSSPERMVVKPSNFDMVFCFLKYLLFPVFITTYLLSSEIERDVLFGLDRVHIFLIPVNILSFWFLYKFIVHIWILENSGNGYLVVDQNGIYSKYNQTNIEWDAVEYMRASIIPSAFYFGWNSFIVRYRVKILEGEMEGKKEVSRIWRLDATDANASELLAYAEHWRKKARAKLGATL